MHRYSGDIRSRVSTGIPIMLTDFSSLYLFSHGEFSVLSMSVTVLLTRMR
jgi:hypothetical protein